MGYIPHLGEKCRGKEAKKMLKPGLWGEGNDGNLN